MHHAAVVIEGNRIVAVGPAAQIQIPADAEVIDTSGRVMMPGMIDLHAHLAVLGHGSYGRWFSWLEEEGISIQQVMEISAKQLLLAGVTTAVDSCGAARSQYLRAGTDRPRGDPRRPDADERPLDHQRGQVLAGGVPDRRLVPRGGVRGKWRRLAEAGVDVIKAWAGLTRDDYQAIADTAHEHGLRVHAHVYGPEEVRNALETGIDVLTHAGSAGTPPYEPELIRDIVVAGRAGGHHRRPPGVGLPGHCAVPRTAPGPAAPPGSAPGHVRRVPAELRELSTRSAISRRPLGRCSSATRRSDSGSRPAP